LSFSIGETVSDPNTITNIEQLMHHADLNMYEYKRSNRIASKQGKSDHLFDHNPDPIAIFDSEGIMLELNPAAQKLIGYTNEEFKGLPYFKLIVEEDQKAVIEGVNSTITSGIPSHFEMKIISRNGALIPLRVVVIPITVGYKIAGYYALGKYILESKKVENEHPHVLTFSI
jgi:PAS domain S-box-containing protein